MVAKKSLCLVEIHGGEKVERHYVYDREFIMGRGEDVAVLIPSVAASRHHFKVKVKERTLWIADLGSSNGTKVSACEIEKNGRMIYAAGEPIRFGDKNLYVTIQLFQTPLEKQEAADEIVADAFANAEDMKRTAAEEAKALSKMESEQILAKARQEAQALLLQAEQQVRITRETADQEIEAERSAAQSEISAMKLKTSKEVVQKMEVAQKQIEQTLKGGLKEAEEKASQFEKARRDKLDAEIQSLLELTRVKGRQEVEVYLKQAQDQMRQERDSLIKTTQSEMEMLRTNTQSEVEKIKQEARDSAARVITTFRKKRVSLIQKFEHETKAYQNQIQDLQNKKSQMEDQTGRAKTEADAALQRKGQLSEEVKKIELERSQKQQSFDKMKKEADHEIESRNQQLHLLKNELALVSDERKKNEVTVQALKDQTQTLEKKVAELKHNFRSQDQIILDAQRELLKIERRKTELDEQIETRIAFAVEKQREKVDGLLKKANAQAARIIQDAKATVTQEFERAHKEIEERRLLQEQAVQDELTKSQDNILRRKALYAKEFSDQRDNVITSLGDELERLAIAKLKPGHLEGQGNPSQWRQEIGQCLSNVVERVLVQSEIKSIVSDRASQRGKRRREMLLSLFSFKRAIGVAFVALFFASLFYSNFTESPLKAHVPSESYVDYLIRNPSFARFIADPSSRERWKDEIKRYLTERRQVSEADIEKLVKIEELLLEKLNELKQRMRPDSRNQSIEKMYLAEIRSRDQIGLVLKGEEKVRDLKSFERKYFAQLLTGSNSPSQNRAPAAKAATP
jgi:pSer/pThr/pTyr-binding forkhead associated (FHA) protein